MEEIPTVGFYNNLEKLYQISYTHELTECI